MQSLTCRARHTRPSRRPIRRMASGTGRGEPGDTGGLSGHVAVMGPDAAASRGHFAGRWGRACFADADLSALLAAPGYHARVAAIWGREGSNWRLLSPAGFPDEASLHRLVEEAPQVLPLSGEPGLIIVGREVQLGSGYADLVAIEPSGRIAIIEIKLAANAESRRAVIAQVLAYAAFLDRASFEDAEAILERGLHERGWKGLGDAAASAESVDFDPVQFRDALEENLRQGRFRLVLVLDDVPTELVRLVGYLARIGSGLTIDLLKVSMYEVNGSQVLVPQRVDPDRAAMEAPAAPSSAARKATLVNGAAEFITGVAGAVGHDREKLDKLVAWATQLEAEGLARLVTTLGVTGLSLRPVLPYGSGLATIWFYAGRGSITLWPSGLQRRAPRSLEKIEAILGKPVVEWKAIEPVTDEFLEVLTDAYREARQTLATSPDKSVGQ